MIFGSVCSGIEAASVAWKGLGWQAAWFAEIDPFCSALLAQRHPDVPNLGDLTLHEQWNPAPVDLLVGGTPCQSFSVAGRRAGLDDPRGELTFVYLEFLRTLRPRWLVWENVPGVLSIDGGRTFGAFLGALAQLGYGFAYRVLDAQYFGVPQRRRRVFVVGHLGDWRRAATILFERHSLQGHPAPCRQAGQGLAHDVAPCLTSSGRGVERTGDSRGQDAVIGTLCMATGQAGAEIGADIAPTLNCNHEAPIAFNLRGRDGGTQLKVDSRCIANIRSAGCGSSRTMVPHPIAFDCKSSGQNAKEIESVAPTLRAMGHAHSNQNGGGHQAVAYGIPGNWIGRAPENGGNAVEPMHDVAPCLTQADKHAVAFAHDQRQEAHALHVRRLTPRECERLQGFPDDYTLVTYRGKPAADGPRYRALGNSMAVPVMRWIGERIACAEQLLPSTKPV
jgi:DNA (cytosine-5)-methyltransferase 1